jgi:hypothetical protein
MKALAAALIASLALSACSGGMSPEEALYDTWRGLEAGEKTAVCSSFEAAGWTVASEEYAPGFSKKYDIEITPEDVTEFFAGKCDA